jgi:magnesium chelatase accessory protein
LHRFRDDRLSLQRDGRDWPNRTSSRFVEAGGLRWHVQRLGRGPRLLLLHGTGAGTHSWRGLLPLLARDFDVLAPDLPGHAFTDPMERERPSLVNMARAVGALLRHLDFAPDESVGHSAGAAILARLCLDREIEPRRIVSLNGALLPFDGLAGHIFPPMAKMLFLNPLAPRLFAWTADRAAVARLLRGTGSTIDPAGVALYARLLANPAHVAGALGMMANWDLDRLAPDLRRLPTPVALVTGTNDKAVPPEAARRLQEILPAARVHHLRGLGHLAHEEKPDMAAELILRLSIGNGRERVMAFRA